MTIVLLRNALTILLAVIIGIATLAASAVPGPAKRGDYPQCQEACLSILKKRMADASEDYKKTGNKLLYQERAETIRLDYDSCIDDCKEVFPVK